MPTERNTTRINAHARRKINYYSGLRHAEILLEGTRGRAECRRKRHAWENRCGTGWKSEESLSIAIVDQSHVIPTSRRSYPVAISRLIVALTKVIFTISSYGWWHDKGIHPKDARFNFHKRTSDLVSFQMKIYAEDRKLKGLKQWTGREEGVINNRYNSIYQVFTLWYINVQYNCISVIIF